MATNDSYIQVTPDGIGKKVDTSTLTQPSGDIVYRERDTIASPTDVAAIAEVRSRFPDALDYAVATRDVLMLQMMELQKQMLEEMRAIRVMMTDIFTEDGRHRAEDFVPSDFSDEQSELVAPH